MGRAGSSFCRAAGVRAVVTVCCCAKCDDRVGGGPAIRAKGYWILLALPFVMMAAAGAARAIVGPHWGTPPLGVVGPAVAAAVGGLYYTLAAGAVALAECVLLALDMYPDMRPAHVAFNATIGVTVVGAVDLGGPRGAARPRGGGGRLGGGG